MCMTGDGCQSTTLRSTKGVRLQSSPQLSLNDPGAIRISKGFEANESVARPYRFSFPVRSEYSARSVHPKAAVKFNRGRLISWVVRCGIIESRMKMREGQQRC